MDNSSKYFDKFGDEFVNRISWDSVSEGGASYQTHKLKKISEFKYGFFMTFGDLMFCAGWMITGCICVVGSICYMIYDGSFNYHFLFAIAFGIIVGPIGLILYLISSVPRIIDLKEGIYYRSRKAPKNLNNIGKDSFAYLEDIYAIQIILEKDVMKFDHWATDRHHSKEGSFSSLELNFVFKDTSRVNIIDHGNLFKLREDAESLSRILRVPVWDATLYRELN